MNNMVLANFFVSLKKKLKINIFIFIIINFNLLILCKTIFPKNSFTLPTIHKIKYLKKMKKKTFKNNINFFPYVNNDNIDYLYNLFPKNEKLTFFVGNYFLFNGIHHLIQGSTLLLKSGILIIKQRMLSNEIININNFNSNQYQLINFITKIWTSRTIITCFMGFLFIKLGTYLEGSFINSFWVISFLSAINQQFPLIKFLGLLSSFIIILNKILDVKKEYTFYIILPNLIISYLSLLNKHGHETINNGRDFLIVNTIINSQIIRSNLNPFQRQQLQLYLIKLQLTSLLLIETGEFITKKLSYIQFYENVAEQYI